MHLLQHQADRAATYGQMHPHAAMPELGCIGVTDPGLIAEIMRSDNFHVVDHAAASHAIMERTGLDLSGIVTALDHIPLAQEGERHRCLRGEVAGVIGPRTRTVEDELARLVPELIESRFVAGARVDLVGDLCLPLYDRLFSTLLGLEDGAFRQPDDIGLVFDGVMSLNRRRKLDSALRGALETLTGFSDRLPLSPELGVALAILGKDALVGTLTLSIWDQLGGGQRLDEIGWPAHPTATAVPYSDRVAQDDCVIGSLAVARGQRFRLYLDATTAQALGVDSGLMFGKGRHLCLGRPLTLAAWRIVTRALATLPLKATCETMHMRENDYVFVAPQAAWIELHA